MQSLDNNTQAFLALVRAGLWEKEVRLSAYDTLDYPQVLNLSEEQSVVGLVAAGLEHVADGKPPKAIVLQLVGKALQLEQRNQAMNDFISSSVEAMRKEGIHSLLVKGAGLAQCYERPLWRSCGDIDFFFSQDEYDKAVDFFLNQENAKEVQNAHYTKSFGVVIEPWFIEIHGTLRNGLSTKMDKEIDAVQREQFEGKKARSWENGKTVVCLPSPDNDVFLVFVHFVRHFYKEGVNLRQLCDWCRLLWKYRSELDAHILEKRIKRSDLMGEWRAFAALAVDYLDMPVDAMPLYSADKKWHVKGEKIMSYILDRKESGKIAQTLTIAKIFPGNTIRFSPSIFFHLNWLKIKERVFGNGHGNRSTTT